MNVDDTAAVETLAPGPDPDDQKRAEIHHQVALVFGYNELAKRSQTLGERLYFRIARNLALDKVREAGGQIAVDEDPVVMTLGDGPPSVKLYEKDIEDMRAAVAAFDAKKKDEAGERR